MRGDADGSGRLSKNHDLRSAKRAGHAKRQMDAGSPRFPGLLPAELLVEELERALPRELRGGFVVARGGVVVEAVVGAGVVVGGVLDAGLLERLLVGEPAGVHALVVLGELEEALEELILVAARLAMTLEVRRQY